MLNRSRTWPASVITAHATDLQTENNTSNNTLILFDAVKNLHKHDLPSRGSTCTTCILSSDCFPVQPCTMPFPFRQLVVFCIQNWGRGSWTGVSLYAKGPIYHYCFEMTSSWFEPCPWSTLCHFHALNPELKQSPILSWSLSLESASFCSSFRCASRYTYGISSWSLVGDGDITEGIQLCPMHALYEKIHVLYAGNKCLIDSPQPIVLNQV